MDDNKDLHFVLDQLGIRHLHPGKLTTQDLNVISELYKSGRGLPTPKSIQDFFSIFQHGLKLCHPLTRNLQVPRDSYSPYSVRFKRTKPPDKTSQATKKEDVEIHPLDIQLAIFLCCNQVAKQDFIALLWKCKFGCPFLVHLDQLEPLNVFTRALDPIIYNGSTDGCRLETRLNAVPMRYICFMRYGRITKSKSKILNKVICRSQKEHSVFFHRDNIASVKHRAILSDGLIELMCGQMTKLDDCMYLNLRGDVAEFPLQLSTMAEIACVFVVVCSLEKMEKSNFILQKLTKYHEKVYILYLLTDLAEEDTQEKVSRVFRFVEDVDSKIVIEIVPMKDSPENAVTEEVVRFLSKTEPTIHVLDDIENMLCSKATMDNTVQSEIDDKISQLMTTFPHTRSECFPLSGKPFEEWSKANKEIHKLQYRPVDIDIETYRSKMESKKIKHRIEQSDMLKTTPLFSTRFIGMFQGIVKDKREAFLRTLSQRLEDGNRTETGRAQNNITDIIMSSIGMATTLDSNPSETYHHLVAEIDRFLLTISDLMFEIGQLYEAQTDTPHHTDLPGIAVEMLMNGYPFPLMDRNTSTVPITWVNAVLKELNRKLSEKEECDVQIMVVSILGIQSTGKSSLLNTLFGAGFTVGSGRCTRGIYMHVVRLVGNTDVKYVFVIDTEGLCAIEDYANTAKERELATFVLGLADVTILNIMGENTTYLRDILPISVHAFLRMNLVGLHPKCIVVHQNVDRLHKHILENQWNQLENTLDKYTQAACDIERVAPKRFRDIVELCITKDIYPFPAYKTDVSNIDPISVGYSESCMELLRDVIDIGNRKERPTILAEFRHYITLLWSAVDRENFVYNFKNTAEAAAKSKLSHHMCIVSWKLRHEARNKLHDLDATIQNSTSEQECRDNHLKVKDDFTSHMDTQYSVHRQDLKEFFKKAHSVFWAFLQGWKKDSLMKLETIYNQITENKFKELEAIREHQIRKLQLASLKSSHNLKEFISNALYENDEATPEDINSCWMQRCRECPDIDFEKEINLQSSICFYEAFPSHRNLVEERLREGCLPKHIDDFHILEKYVSIGCDNYLDETQKEKVESAIRSIMTKVKDQLNQRIQERRRFDTESFIQVLLLLKTNKELTDELLPTNIEFEIDLAQSILEFTKTELIRNERQITRELALQDQIGANESLKLVQELVIVVKADSEESINRVLNILTQGMLERISNRVLMPFEARLSKYKKHGMEIASSKRLFLLSTIYKLIKENQPNLFQVYFTYPVGILRGFLSDLFDQMCQFGEEKSDVSKDVISCAKDLFMTVKAVIEESDTDVSDDKTWLEKTFNKLGTFLALPALTMQMPLKQAKLLQHFEELETKFTEEALESVFERNYDSIRSQVVDETLQSLGGCRKRCPGCREICMNENPDHADKHQVLMHKTFVLNGSTQLMTCNQFYTNTSPNMTGWEVAPDILSCDSIWQLCTVLYSGVEPSSLPDTWKQWDRETEMKKLRVLMTNCCELS